VSGFFDKWAEPFVGRTLEQAKIDAQAVASVGGGPWSGADDIVIYGYKDLLWQETPPFFP